MTQEGDELEEGGIDRIMEHQRAVVDAIADVAHCLDANAAALPQSGLTALSRALADLCPRLEGAARSAALHFAAGQRLAPSERDRVGPTMRRGSSRDVATPAALEILARKGGDPKKATHDISLLLEMLVDLNNLGALDGLVFAAVRRDGEAPLYGRVCGAIRSYELLGAGHTAVFALSESLDCSAEVVADGSQPSGGA